MPSIWEPISLETWFLCRILAEDIPQPAQHGLFSQSLVCARSFLLAVGIRDYRYISPQIGFLKFYAVDGRPFLAADQYTADLFRQLYDLADGSDTAHLVHICSGRICDFNISLGSQEDLLISFHRLIDRCQGFLPADVKMPDHPGQYRKST